MKSCLWFLLGAATGCVATYIFMKKSYETEEVVCTIDDIKKEKESKPGTEALKEALNMVEQNPAINNALKPDIMEYVKNNKTKVYTDYTNGGTIVREQLGDKPLEEPYVIKPEVVNEYDDYDIKTLTYYSDGILANDDDEIIEDVENTVGEDFKDYFGVYDDDDMVYVRNDIQKCDYEIVKNDATYEEVTGINPHGKED